MSTMRTVHKEMTAQHEKEEGVGGNSGRCNLEDENRNEPCDHGYAQNPNHGRNVERALIVYIGIVFHISHSLEGIDLRQ